MVTKWQAEHVKRVLMYGKIFTQSLWDNGIYSKGRTNGNTTTQHGVKAVESMEALNAAADQAAAADKSRHGSSYQAAEILWWF